MQRHIFSTFTHGVIDYTAGILLLIVPTFYQLAGFSDLAGTILQVLGIVIVVQSLLTDFELGLLKIISFRVHKTIDVVLGAYLAASPFLHGFASDFASSWVPHMVIGIGLILAGVLTENAPYRHRTLLHA